METNNRTLQDIVDQAEYIDEETLDSEYTPEETVIVRRYQVSKYDNITVFTTSTDFHVLWRVVKECSTSCREKIDVTTYNDDDLPELSEYLVALGCTPDNMTFKDEYNADLILELGDDGCVVYFNSDIVLEFEGTTTADSFK